MTTENVMKLGKTERVSFSFVLLSFLHIYRPWMFETMQTDDFANVLHHQKKKKKIHQKSIRFKQWKMH